MKKVYKYIRFERDGTGMFDNKPFYYCKNNRTKATLGSVLWHSAWKQYVFHSSDRLAVFSADCLRDIAAFMEQLNE